MKSWVKTWCGFTPTLGTVQNKGRGFRPGVRNSLVWARKKGWIWSLDAGVMVVRSQCTRQGVVQRLPTSQRNLPMLPWQVPEIWREIKWYNIAVDAVHHVRLVQLLCSPALIEALDHTIAVLLPTHAARARFRVQLRLHLAAAAEIHASRFVKIGAKILSVTIPEIQPLYQQLDLTMFLFNVNDSPWPCSHQQV